MQQPQSFRALKVWQKSMLLVEQVYRLTATFPADERFGLTSQLRRASVSIPSNIGEGRRRKGQRVFLHHLDIALGSQGEIDVQLEIARRLGFLKDDQYHFLQEQVAEVGKMLNGLMASLRPHDKESEPA